MTLDFLAFAEFAAFWERLQPLSPFGRDAKARQGLLVDALLLERLWDLTEAAGELLSGGEGASLELSRIRHHLQRLPRIPEDAQAVLGEVELFEVKKFLHNYTRLRELLPPGPLACFALPEAPGALFALLDRGRQGAESFFLSDAYSADLAAIRQEIRATDARLESLRVCRLEEIAERLGVAFGDRPFLVLEGRRLADPEAVRELLEVEPFDAGRLRVCPRPPAEAWPLREARETLQVRERLAEEGVMAELAASVREALPDLLACRDAVAAFDLALARARLAQDWALVRPRLEPGALRVQGGRFLPCEALCQRLGLPYTPLDADFPGAMVIFGANMGGKTVVLKTLAFLQACVQHGLFVPARAFVTRVFRCLRFIGEGEPGATQGLSGFGREIRRVVEHLDEGAANTLLLLDEFARTTSSREAEALLGALLERLAREPGACTLCSTHLRGLVRSPGIDYRCMAGLKAGAAEGLGGATGLEERIRQIDRLMDYRLVEDGGPGGVSDALTIASLLGLPGALVTRATVLMDAYHEEG
nr:hypothetical protein [uncultured Holophaga sp.]